MFLKFNLLKERKNFLFSASRAKQLTVNIKYPCCHFRYNSSLFFNVQIKNKLYITTRTIVIVLIKFAKYWPVYFLNSCFYFHIVIVLFSVFFFSLSLSRLQINRIISYWSMNFQIYSHILLSIVKESNS